MSHPKQNGYPGDISKTIEYQHVGSLEDAKVRNVHNVCVCPIQFKDIVYFATVSSNRCIIYCINKGNEIKVIQEYIDDNPRENFTCCEWIIIQTKTGTPTEMYIAVGGSQAQIKILDCMKQVVRTILVGHVGAIQVIQSLHKEPYRILSSSVDGTVRMWDIRKGSPLKMITLDESFSVLSYFDVKLNDEEFVCTDRNGTVCTYKYSTKTNNYEFDKMIHTGHSGPTLWVGRYLLGVINGTCSLYSPDIQEVKNNEKTAIIKVLKLFALADAPSMYCINKSASILACVLHNTIKLYDIDNDMQPYYSFSIQYFNTIPSKIFFYGDSNSIMVLMNDGSVHLYSPVSSSKMVLEHAEKPYSLYDSDELFQRQDIMFDMIPNEITHEI